MLKRTLQPFEREILLFPRICSLNTCREWNFEKLIECNVCGQVSIFMKIYCVLDSSTYTITFFFVLFSVHIASLVQIIYRICTKNGANLLNCIQNL